MKLSEAIRKGCENTKQGFLKLGNVVSNETCALGSSIYALTGYIPHGNYMSDEVKKTWNQYFFKILNTYVKCPCSCNKYSPLRSCVSHLNDIHKWSRESIAMWVESIENKIEAEILLSL